MTGETPPAGRPPRTGSLAKDIWPRVASGVVLAAVAFGLLYAGVYPFAALVLAVALVMSWEWGGVVRGRGIDVVLVVHAAAIVAAAGLSVAGFAALGLLAVVVGAIIVTALSFGERSHLSSFGVLYTGLPVAALLWFRGDGDRGFHAVLALVALVATTDIFAYFSGRLIGGPKLWPRVSPNKTWAGLIGGVGAAVAVGALLSKLIPDASPLVLALTGLLVGLVAQAGDLAESALKRSFEVKDASHLIPGHGGFMDRMDGLVAASVAAAVFAIAINAHAPATALLFWR